MLIATIVQLDNTVKVKIKHDIKNESDFSIGKAFLIISEDYTEVEIETVDGDSLGIPLNKKECSGEYSYSNAKYAKMAADNFKELVKAFNTHYKC